LLLALALALLLLLLLLLHYGMLRRIGRAGQGRHGGARDAE
jgi:hypothetical protein